MPCWRSAFGQDLPTAQAYVRPRDRSCNHVCDFWLEGESCGDGRFFLAVSEVGCSFSEVTFCLLHERVNRVSRGRDLINLHNTANLSTLTRAKDPTFRLVLG